MSVKLKANSALALAFCAVLFCSCGTKEELFESYDSCFVPIPNGYASFTLTPETQSLMLRDVYRVSFDYNTAEWTRPLPVDVPGITLTLSCPAECDSYDWKITRLKDSVILSDNQKPNGYHWNTRNIDIYFPKSDDCIFYKEVKESKKSCSYLIHLEVKVGEQYFYDSAYLVVKELSDG